MPVHTSWDNPEQTILCHEFERVWTEKDMHDALNQAFAMINSVPHQVDVILDMSGTKSAPNLLSIFRRIERHMPRNTGLLVFVGAPGIIPQMLKIARNVTPALVSKIANVDSREDAYALLKKRRGSHHAF